MRRRQLHDGCLPFYQTVGGLESLQKAREVAALSEILVALRASLCLHDGLLNTLGWKRSASGGHCSAKTHRELPPCVPERKRWAEGRKVENALIAKAAAPSGTGPRLETSVITNLKGKRNGCCASQFCRAAEVSESLAFMSSE